VQQQEPLAAFRGDSAASYRPLQMK
jgi:hypothetical protein